MLETQVLANLIFAVGTLASLTLACYKYRNDRNAFFFLLSSMATTGSVFGFVIAFQIKAPRSISLSERHRITAKMQAFAGQEYTGYVASGASDAGDLWREISLVLELAQWKPWCCLSRPITQAYGPVASIWEVPIGNIHIFWTSPAQQPAADALAKALSAEGLSAFSGPMYYTHPS